MLQANGWNFNQIPEVNASERSILCETDPAPRLLTAYGILNYRAPAELLREPALGQARTLLILKTPGAFPPLSQLRLQVKL